MKTKKSLAKRIKITALGKIKKNKAGMSHILTKKSASRKRHLKHANYMNSSDAKHLKQLLPYAF
jgi:large subunit ribosomal protein L35